METHFQKLDLFRNALHHYHPSPESQAVLLQTPFVALVGPTASGRDTIIGELVKNGYYYAIVTDTTRPPRINKGIPERNGVEYFFRHEDEMLEDLHAGRFLEAAIVHKHYVYGVNIREIQKAHSYNKIAITDIEVVGTDAIRRMKPDTIAIFVLPPSLEVWFSRIRRRNPDITEDELNRRLASARNEFKVALDRDYYQFVINDDLSTAVDEIDAIIRHHQTNAPEQQRAKALSQQLLKELDSLCD